MGGAYLLGILWFWGRVLVVGSQLLVFSGNCLGGWGVSSWVRGGLVSLNWRRWEGRGCVGDWCLNLPAMWLCRNQRFLTDGRTLNLPASIPAHRLDQ